jgi:hypothetical protein
LEAQNAQLLEKLQESNAMNARMMEFMQNMQQYQLPHQPSMQQYQLPQQPITESPNSPRSMSKKVNPIYSAGRNPFFLPAPTYNRYANQ